METARRNESLYVAPLLDALRTRGLARVRQHADLVMIARLAVRLVQVRDAIALAA